MKESTTEAVSPNQRLYREVLVGSLIYSVVLGFLDSYTSIVYARSYSYLFSASILLELLTMGAFAIKRRIVARFRDRDGARFKAAMGLGVWFVLFSSKFVFVGVINLVFGDDVDVNGFFGILVVVTCVTVLRRLSELIDSTLERPGPRGARI